MSIEDILQRNINMILYSDRNELAEFSRNDQFSWINYRKVIQKKIFLTILSVHFLWEIISIFGIQSLAIRLKKIRKIRKYWQNLRLDKIFTLHATRMPSISSSGRTRICDESFACCSENGIPCGLSAYSGFNILSGTALFSVWRYGFSFPEEKQNEWSQWLV